MASELNAGENKGSSKAIRKMGSGRLSSRTAMVGIAALLAGAGTFGLTAAGSAASTTVPVGTAASIPTGSTNLGAAASQSLLHLEIALQPRDQTALTNFISAVSTPSSPQYRQYLEPGQYGPMFGATPATISAVTSQLTKDGLTVGTISSNDTLLPVTATVGAADAAFGVHIESFRSSSGQVVDANTTAPTVPSTIADSVAGIVGLDGLGQAVPGDVSAPDSTTDTVESGNDSTPVAGAAPGEPTPSTASDCVGDQAHGLFTADQIAQAYDVDPLYDGGDFGGGQTAAVLELSGYAGSDVANYQKCYGTNVDVDPISVNPNDGNPSGNKNKTGSGADEAEGDIETIISVAPDLKQLRVYESENTFAGEVAIYNEMASQDLAKSISSSWYQCEAGNSGQADAEYQAFRQMAAQGQTMFVLTGDQGSEGCYSPPPTPLPPPPYNQQTQLAVDDPGSDPYVTSVGGTDLTALGNPPLVSPTESVWNDAPANSAPPNTGSYNGSNLTTGGGVSSIWPMPSWQSGDGVNSALSSSTACAGFSIPTDKGKYPAYPTSPSGDCRESPDVSSNSEGLYDEYILGRWQGFGGTSASTPMWAGLISTMDSSATECNKGIGFIDPTLYALATSTPSDFNDVTSGNNDYLLAHNGTYSAIPGYDMATGLGSPVGANLAQSFCPRTVISVKVSGTQSFGAASPTLKGAETLPSGVTISGSLHCPSVNDGINIIPTLAAGDYTVDGGLCYGLKASKPGAYVIQYTGDSGGLVVSTDKTTTKLSLDHTSEPYGNESAVKFSASVTTGNGEVLPVFGSTVTVNVGTASCTFIPEPAGHGGSGSCTIADTALPHGTFKATATYDANNVLDSSTSSAVNLTITKDTTTTQVTASPAIEPYGSESSTTFTVVVTTGHGEEMPGLGEATVTVGSDTCEALLGPVSNGASGVCNLSGIALPPGSDKFSAKFTTDDDLATSISPTSTFTVTKETTSSELTESAASEPFGAEAAAVFTVIVTSTNHVPLPGTESVTVNVGSAHCVATVAPTTSGGSGACSLSAAALPVGTYTATAMYRGDADLSGSTSSNVFAVTSQVSGTTFTQVSGSPNPSTSDGAFTITAQECDTGANVQATGTMSFTDVTTGQVLGTSTMGASSSENCGQATMTDTESLAPGTYEISATYSPGGALPVQPSAPGTYSQTVNGSLP